MSGSIELGRRNQEPGTRTRGKRQGAPGGTGHLVACISRSPEEQYSNIYDDVGVESLRRGGLGGSALVRGLRCGFLFVYLSISLLAWSCLGAARPRCVVAR
jgi:hypothetical protein